jgi:uncharacterized membrane protein
MDDEMIALQSIYEIDFLTDPLIIATQSGEYSIRFSFPDDYPDVNPPSFSLKMPPLFHTSNQIEWEKKTLALVKDAMKQMFIPGEPLIFDFVEWLSDYLCNLKLEKENEVEDDKIVVSISEISSARPIQIDNLGYGIVDGCPLIFHSTEPLIERKSTFIAHCARVTSLKDVKLVRKSLMANKYNPN